MKSHTFRRNVTLTDLASKVQSSKIVRKKYDFFQKFTFLTLLHFSVKLQKSLLFLCIFIYFHEKKLRTCPFFFLLSSLYFLSNYSRCRQNGTHILSSNQCLFCFEVTLDLMPRQSCALANIVIG